MQCWFPPHSLQGVNVIISHPASFDSEVWAMNIVTRRQMKARFLPRGKRV